MDHVLKYFQAGGVMMWPLLACSVLAVAVVIERAWRLRRKELIDPAVVDDIQTHIERGQPELALSRYRTGPVLAGRILSRAIDEHLHTSASIETSLTEAGERGLQVLNNNLSVLTVISRVAPLMGLLGTVLGMITGFEILTAEGAGEEQVGRAELAAAISVALVTTATGLIIAIPTVVANAYFRSRIRRLTAEFEEVFIDIVKTVNSASKPVAVERTEKTPAEVAT